MNQINSIMAEACFFGRSQKVRSSMEKNCWKRAKIHLKSSCSSLWRRRRHLLRDVRFLASKRVIDVNWFLYSVLTFELSLKQLIFYVAYYSMSERLISNKMYSTVKLFKYLSFTSQHFENSFKLLQHWWNKSLTERSWFQSVRRAHREVQKQKQNPVCGCILWDAEDDAVGFCAAAFECVAAACYRLSFAPWYIIIGSRWRAFELLCFYIQPKSTQIIQICNMYARNLVSLLNSISVE